jgi:hypothetical protein
MCLSIIYPLEQKAKMAYCQVAGEKLPIKGGILYLGWLLDPRGCQVEEWCNCCCRLAPTNVTEASTTMDRQVLPDPEIAFRPVDQKSSADFEKSSANFTKTSMHVQGSIEIK